jgi:hypothetical protein
MTLRLVQCFTNILYLVAYFTAVDSKTIGKRSIEKDLEGSSRDVFEELWRHLRSALFWDITRSRVVNVYHTTPRNIPEECRSNQHRGRSLKSMYVGICLEGLRKSTISQYNRCICLDSNQIPPKNEGTVLLHDSAW